MKRTKRQAIICSLAPAPKKAKLPLHLETELLTDKLDFALRDHIASFFPGVKKVGRYSSFDYFKNFHGNVIAASKKRESDQEQEWCVEAIVGHRVYHDGDGDLLILWRESDPLFPGVNTGDLPFFPVLSVIELRKAHQDIPLLLWRYIDQFKAFIDAFPVFVLEQYRDYTNYFK